MTARQGNVPEEFMTTMRPEFVAPAVALMVSEQTSLNGQVIIAGRGVFRRAANVEGRGLRYAEPTDATPEALARDIEEAARHARCDRVCRCHGSVPAAVRPVVRSEVMHQLGAATDAPMAWPSPARAWWTVAVLTFTYIVSFVDRTILGLLIEPIKADLSLNDTQIGLVQGMAFGLFYAAMGCRWAGSRTALRVAV